MSISEVGRQAHQHSNIWQNNLAARNRQTDNAPEALSSPPENTLSNCERPVSNKRAGFQVYNSKADMSKNNEAKQDLIESLKEVRNSGQEVNRDTLTALFTDNPKEFIETLSEITGKTQGQVMASLLNMNQRDAAGLCNELGKLTGADASCFVKVVSKVTGAEERLLLQTLNSEDEDEDEDKQGSDKSQQEQKVNAAMKQAQTLSLIQRLYIDASS